MVKIQASHNNFEMVIKVSDQGIGIPADQLEKVFERMYRVEHPSVERVGGTGLGLSICKGIVEAHGGSIWIESPDGNGTVCIFTLPLDMEDDNYES